MRLDLRSNVLTASVPSSWSSLTQVSMLCMLLPDVHFLARVTMLSLLVTTTVPAWWLLVGQPNVGLQHSIEL